MPGDIRCFCSAYEALDGPTCKPWCPCQDLSRPLDCILAAALDGLCVLPRGAVHRERQSLEPRLQRRCKGEKACRRPEQGQL